MSNEQLMRGGVMVARGTLTPKMKVRFLPPQNVVEHSLRDRDVRASNSVILYIFIKKSF